MMCNKCGTSNVDNAKFCARCGNSLGVSYSNQPAEAKDGCFIDGMKRWSDFDGKATRSQYWCFVLFQWLLTVAFFAIITFINEGNNEEPNIALSLFIIVTYIIMLVPLIAIQIRRLHDSNKSAWVLLLLVIPYIGALIILVINLLPSDKGSN